MFAPMLLTLAIAAGADQAKPITIVENAPSIVIPIAGYDLARASDVRHLETRIWFAATSVCDVNYGVVRDPETVACRNRAVADADAQLGRFLAHPSTAALTSAIAVTRPGH